MKKNIRIHYARIREYSNLTILKTQNSDHSNISILMIHYM